MIIILQPDRLLLKRQLASLAHYLSGRILDAGAGATDRYSHLFAATEYLKLDITPGPNVDFIGSVENLPFPDNYFDSIVSTQVLEHVPHPWRVIKEFSRVLKPGGVLLLTVPQMNELHEEPHDFFRYTKYGLESLLTEIGLTIMEISPRGGFFAALAQQLVRYLTDQFNLYHRPIIGRIGGKILSWFSRLAIFIDDRTSGEISLKYTIGWAVVAAKK